MAQKEYMVEGRSFRTGADYKLALKDREKISDLREKMTDADLHQLEQLREDVENGKCRFYTLLGQDFEDELTDLIKQRKAEEAPAHPKQHRNKRKNGSQNKKCVIKSTRAVTQVSEREVLQELKRQEKRRKWLIAACSLGAVLCLGYSGIYVYFGQRTAADYEKLQSLKEKVSVSAKAEQAAEQVIHYTNEERETPEVLDEYKNLLIKNKKLIGWVKIDDTKIDYPVMQTGDNEYYLTHNMNQEYDKNGCIFLDKDCDVIKPSTNLILYGHHMQSGKMFGTLSKYSDEKYYKAHPYINFDTIYEKGVYEVMYVFRSRVYNEEDVVFKYYQFIDAMSEVEFDSYMKEMADVSLYDTGVTASYGDRLLTLSTCDYQEKNGRFVVVAKRVSKKE